MAPRTLLFALFVAASFCFVRCSMRSNLVDFVPSLRHDQDHQARDPYQASSSYLNMNLDGKLKGFIKKNTDIVAPLKRVSATQLSSIMTVNVIRFGAKGDGHHDDSVAFKQAWEKACSSKSGALILVPKGRNYLLKPTTFSGPCESSIDFQILGTIEASAVRSDYKDLHWLLFENVNDLLFQGGGTINGNGNIWWQNSCKINKELACTTAPTALTFYKNKNLVVKNLNIKDAQQIQLSFENCVNVKASYITVTAPDESPNTDGIHVTNTQNIHISNSIIGTGDDCISIVSGSKNVQATDITCGPGHGISIGSLGKNSEDYVSGIIVDRAKLIGTTNGVRIKTWQGRSGSATNITFQNIVMEDVINPIIIDQNYCDQITPCKTQDKAIQVKNVLYKSIKGTSASDVAIKFDCSNTYHCQGIVLHNIDLALNSVKDEAKASCNNIELLDIGEVSPRC